MELTDKMIVEDIFYSGKTWFIIGAIILLAIVLLALFLKKKNRYNLQAIFFLVFCVILAGASFVFGFLTIKNACDYKVISTVVVDKKYDSSVQRRKSTDSKDKQEYYHVYFENDFIPDTSSSGYNSCEIGDKVIIVHSQKSGYTSYYYGDYKYVGSKSQDSSIKVQY